MHRQGVMVKFFFCFENLIHLIYLKLIAYIEYVFNLEWYFLFLKKSMSHTTWIRRTD